jgi:hypothetical protein
VRSAIPIANDNPFAIAADYADALLVLRRSKGMVELILFLLLIGQIVLFSVVRFTPVLSDSVSGSGAVDVVVVPQDSYGTATRPSTSDLLTYATAMTLGLGLIMGLLLPAVLLLIHHVMLVGRLVGVGRVSGALVWSIVLLLVLVPWQTMLITAELERPDFVPPGVLYTWGEIRSHARFESGLTEQSVLRWARFVGAPVAAIVVLLIVRVKSGRGLKLALGEEAIVLPRDATLETQARV